MEVKRKGKTIYRYSIKRLLYTICFFFFCVIDQRTKTASGLDGVIETFRDLTGVVMAVLIMSHYKIADFKKYKLPYLVWTAAAVIGSVGAYIWGRANRPFLNDWVVVMIDVVLFGYILIHTFISVFIEKKYPKLNKKFAVTWLVMMLLMIGSRSNYIWPLCYLVMFGCFYLTDYSKEEEEDMFQGMLDGIILGFFVMQGLCFVFRPYDRVRYQGIYHNCNLNALFYLEVLAAVFGKILYVTKEKAGKWLRVYYWLGAGVVLSFIFMTIGRTAWIVAFLMGLLMLWAVKKITLKKNFIKNGLVLILCVCITFPLCFGAARYLPPVFHHPIWFWGEWGDERVHSWDLWDSEKYVEMDEFFEEAGGRIVDGVGSLLKNSPLGLRAQASNNVDVLDNIEEQDNIASNKEPVLKTEDSSDVVLVRSTIYKHYFRELNISGHPYEEQGFQLTPLYWIGHAHNIFLQYGTDFGVPVMVLFLVLIVWTIIRIGWSPVYWKDNMLHGKIYFALVPTLFGMLECSWGTGSLSIIMIFVIWRECISYKN